MGNYDTILPRGFDNESTVTVSLLLVLRGVKKCVVIWYKSCTFVLFAIHMIHSKTTADHISFSKCSRGQITSVIVKIYVDFLTKE